MLDKKSVEAEEDRLRNMIARLPDAERKRLYDEIRNQVRDPDTYAAANYAFIVGAHHFYLGRWERGLIDIGAFLAGALLIATPLFPVGVLILVGVTAVELYNLFRSEVIVQHFNNEIYRRALQPRSRMVGETAARGTTSTGGRRSPTVR